jgi:hypothetical protein
LNEGRPADLKNNAIKSFFEEGAIPSFTPPLGSAGLEFSKRAFNGCDSLAIVGSELAESLFWAAPLI